MVFVNFPNWTRIFLIGLAFVAVNGQTGLGYNGRKYGGKSCDQIRQQYIDLLLPTNERRIPAHVLDQIVTRLVKYFLPIDCLNNVDGAINFNPSSLQDQGGPLGTLGWDGTIYSTSSKTRNKRSADDGEEFDDDFEQAREKRSAENDFAGEELRKERSTDDERATNYVESNLPLNREKRFLNGMTAATAPGAPRREISESERMMNTLLMLTRLQRKQASLFYRKVSNRGFYGDRVSFGNGMYGDQYSGRKKRSTSSSVAKETMPTAEELKAHSRKKRFLFLGEPGDLPPPQPSMMSIMMGTATDPNTGKRIEFGGDYMKRMMRRNFISSVMPFAPPPPAGKEHTDFVKNMAPIWYMQRFNRRPTRRRIVPVVPDYYQRLQPSGYYGDAFPGK